MNVLIMLAHVGWTVCSVLHSSIKANSFVDQKCIEYVSYT